MSIFDKLKSSLGLKSGRSAAGRGHRLGGDADAAAGPALPRSSSGKEATSGSRQFSVTFHDATVGMDVDELAGGGGTGAEGGAASVVVAFVVDGKEASRSGVVPGDAVLAIEGNPVTSAGDFTAVLRALDRPVTVTFERRSSLPPPPPPLDQQQAARSPPSRSSSGGSGSGSGGSGSWMKNPFKGSSSSSGSAGGGGATGALSEAQKAERRAVMANAAVAREQSGNKKFSSSGRRPDPLADGGSNNGGAGATAGGAELHPDTLALVASAKRREEQMVREMGYNPFKPVMASTTNTSGAMVAAGSSSSGGVDTSTSAASPQQTRAPAAPAAAPQPTPVPVEPWRGEEDEAYVAALTDEALALLLSVSVDASAANGGGAAGAADEAGEGAGGGSASQTAVTTALSTAHKMLDNLHRNSGISAAAACKFQSIRVGNAAFQSKVCTVPGGLQLFLAAGFEISATPTPVSAPASGAVSDGNVYLFHSLSERRRRMLAYVVGRLAEAVQ